MICRSSNNARRHLGHRHGWLRRARAHGPADHVAAGSVESHHDRELLARALDRLGARLLRAPLPREVTQREARRGRCRSRRPHHLVGTVAATQRRAYGPVMMLQAESLLHATSAERKSQEAPRSSASTRRPPARRSFPRVHVPRASRAPTPVYFWNTNVARPIRSPNVGAAPARLKAGHTNHEVDAQLQQVLREPVRGRRRPTDEDAPAVAEYLDIVVGDARLGLPRHARRCRDERARERAQRDQRGERHRAPGRSGDIAGTVVGEQGDIAALARVQLEHG